MKTQLQSIHEETYSDGSKTLGVLLNYNEDQTFKESFTFIFNNEKKMYIFFSTIVDMIDYLMYGEMQGKTKIRVKATIHKTGPKAQMAVEGMQYGFTQQLEKLNGLLSLRK